MKNETQKCIIRTDRAGVFFAEVTDRRGSEADLKDARRIHYFNGATECIGIATNGVGKGSRVTVPIQSMTVLGVIEILPMTEKAIESLQEFPEWKA